MTPIRKEYVPRGNVKASRGTGLDEGRGHPVSRKLGQLHIRMSTHERRENPFRAMATKIPQTYLSI